MSKVRADSPAPLPKPFVIANSDLTLHLFIWFLLQKIVLKVDITAERCKAGAMSVVAKLPGKHKLAETKDRVLFASSCSTISCNAGIKSMAVDGEKGTLTVVGDVDVVCLASALRKAKFTALVVSVGPEVVEKKPEPAKEEEPKKPDPPKPAPPCCCSGPGNACCPRPMPPYPGTAIVCYEEQDDGHGCIIL